ncbi:MAG: hypothetical protein PVF83_16965 [Anaerolineales bacterium]|jgi:hypothetical protein
MINGKLSFLSLVMIFTLILTSCSDEISKDTATSSGIVNSPITVEETELYSSTDEELPDIPTISFGPGDAWFQSTDPNQIQLVSGKVQVFKFSASW